MRLIKNEIIKSISLVKIAIIILFMIVISFGVVESSYKPTAEKTLLGKSTLQEQKFEEQESIYAQNPTADNLYLVYLFRLNKEVEEIKNHHSFYYGEWQDRLMNEMSYDYPKIASLQVMKEGFAATSFKGGIWYQNYTIEKINDELSHLEEARQNKLKLLNDGTYADYVNSEIKNLREEEKKFKDGDSNYTDLAEALYKEKIKIKQYIVDNKIEDEQSNQVIAQKKLEELVSHKEFNVISKNAFEKNYEFKKTYGTYNRYLKFIDEKENRINDEYKRLWFAMENDLELTNDIKSVINKFWPLSFLISLSAVILFANIISREYKTGSIRLLLTQGVKRSKILFAKYTSSLIVTYCLYLLFLIIYLILALFKGGISGLLNPEIIVLLGKPIAINYLLYLIFQIIIMGLPAVFIVTTIFLISTIRESAIASTVIGTILAISSIFIEIIGIFIFVLKWYFLRYLPISYLSLSSVKYGELLSDIDALTSYVLNIKLGIIILLISTIFIYIITHLIFVKKDVRN